MPTAAPGPQELREGHPTSVKTLPILQFVVSARLADIQKKQLDSVARERAKQVARAAAVHLEARRLARAQQVAGP